MELIENIRFGDDKGKPTEKWGRKADGDGRDG